MRNGTINNEKSSNERWDGQQEIMANEAINIEEYSNKKCGM